MSENQFEKTGLDRELPYIEVLMDKADTANYPRYALPEGYSFRFYERGIEEEFANLQYLIGGTGSIDAAREIFMHEFLESLDDLKTRMIYVAAPNGDYAGTACLWQGKKCPAEQNRPRVHWVAVHPAHQNKGISKAMLTRLFDLHNALGLEPYIYLVSQTWSYKAINVYIEFGFNPLICRNLTGSVNKKEQNDNSLAWNLIYDKIELYETAKGKKRDG